MVRKPLRGSTDHERCATDASLSTTASRLTPCRDLIDTRRAGWLGSGLALLSITDSAQTVCLTVNHARVSQGCIQTSARHSSTTVRCGSRKSIRAADGC